MKPPKPPPSAARPGKPIPVRDLQDASEAATEPDAKLEEVSITVDDTHWSVVAEGESFVGGGEGTVRMLLLCFARDGGEDAREAWVVAERLSDVSGDRLDDAFRGATARLDRREPQGFFEELSGRRGR
ncbi:MAG: hypothetical protein WD995_00705 [Gemmatimonadota bacterium]